MNPNSTDPTAYPADSLIRGNNSLFGKTNSLFRTEQAAALILCNISRIWRGSARIGGEIGEIP
jgi:hypothetical protein